MATTRTSAYVTSASTTTQIENRDVGDKIRNLFPANALFTALVSKGEIKAGELKKSKGLIQKRSVTHRRFENYTYTPLAVTATVTSLSSTTLTLSAAVTLPTHYTFVNTANGTTARIDSVTSTTVYEITSFGSSAFSVTADDVLMIGAPAYPQYSSSPTELAKNEDNIYNICQQVRFPVSISDVAKATPTHAVSDYWSRIKEVNVIEGMRKVEVMMLFGNRPSSGDTTSGGAALTDSFETARGAYNWAANTYNAQGAMTPAKWRKDIPQQFTNKVINSNDKVFAFGGSSVNAEMQEWANDRTIMAKDGTMEKFGIKSKVFLTAEFEVELMMHDLFNQGSFANQMLIFKPEALQYVFFTGKDLKPNTNIQSPSTLGFQDEIEGFLSVGSVDAGNSMIKVTNFL